MTMPTFTDGSLVHQGDLNLLSTGINNLSTYLLGAPPPRNYVPHVALRQAISQPIAPLTDVLLKFDTVESNPDNMWVASVNNQLIVNTAGSYDVDAQVSLQGSASDIYMFILVNGTSTSSVNSVGGEDHKPGMTSNDGMVTHAHAFLPNLAVGSVIYVSIFHTASTTLNTPVGRGGARVQARRVGP